MARVRKLLAGVSRESGSLPGRRVAQCLKYAVVVIAAAGLGVLAAFSASLSEARFLYYALLALSFGSVAIGLIVGYRRYRQVEIVSPYVLFPLNYLAVFGIGAAVYLDRSIYTDGGHLLGLLLLGLAGYLAGVFWSNLVRIPGQWGKSADGPVSERDYRTVSLVALCIGVLAMMVFWAKAGGIPALQGNLESSRVSALSGQGIPFYLSMLVMPAVWLRYLSTDEPLSRSDLLLGGFCVAVLISTGWRNTAVALIAVAVLIRHYRRPFRPSTIILLGILLVVGAVSIGLYRVSSSDISGYRTFHELREGNYLGAVWTYLETYPRSFTTAFAAVVHGVPGKLPFQGGSSFFWNFQLLNPGHTAEAFDFHLKEALHLGFVGGGLPPTIPGEMYLNFGVEGVILGMFGVGFVSMQFYKLLKRQRGQSVIALICIISLYYFSVTVRGGLGDVLLTWTWLCLVTLVMHAASPVAFSRPTGLPQSKSSPLGQPTTVPS
jgi:oligosaccharide repeat unit polymerase